MSNREPTMYGSALEMAKFGDYQIREGHMVKQLRDDPELVVRLDAHPLFFGDETERLLEEDRARGHYEGFIRAIRLLHNDYGLHSPNMIVALEQVDSHTKQAYLGMSKIHGSYFRLEHLNTEASFMPYQLDQVPRDVTVIAFDSVLRYYEDVTSDKVGADYIGDLRLGNLMYGRQQGDHEDYVYMIDFHSSAFLEKSEDGYNGILHSIQSSARGGPKLLTDLAVMKEHYGEQFADFQERLDRVQIVAAAKHQAWRASRDGSARLN